MDVAATVLLVVGAAGAPEYGAAFDTWAGRWEEAVRAGGGRLLRVGGGEAAADGQATVETDRERLRALLAAEAKGELPLWVVYLGHGTYDGAQAHWNLAGPDVSSAELAQWLDPVERPLAVLACSAASGPLVNALSRPGRIVVTATRSGEEYSFARFGDALSRAWMARDADLDKDDQVSLLEAFLFAAAEVEAFYAGEGRLATEHALLDDNGDARGTPPEWFRGVRAVQRAADERRPDGALAHRWHLIEAPRERELTRDERRERDRLEAQVEELVARKEALPEDDYYARLEELMVALARIYAPRNAGD